MEVTVLKKGRFKLLILKNAFMVGISQSSKGILICLGLIHLEIDLSKRVGIK